MENDRKYSAAHLQQLRALHEAELGSVVLNMPPQMMASALRAFSGRTAMDAAIDMLPVPRGSLGIWTGVLALRAYRAVRPKSISCRCVFDPSCSRYSELAIRNEGLFRGLLATARRLARCRAGAGGLDLNL